MSNVDCLPAPEILWWWSWVGLSAPHTGRVVAGLLLLLALAACVVLAHGQRKHLDSFDFSVAHHGDHGRHCMAPATWSLGVFAALLMALLTSGFYNAFSTDRINFLAKGAIPTSDPAEFAAGGIWAITFGAVVLASVSVCWVGARVYWTVASSCAIQVIARYVAPVAALPVLAILGLNVADLLRAFGSDASAHMLCSTWARLNLRHLGPMTDGLNVVAILVTFIAAASFCLLLMATRAVFETARSLAANPSQPTPKEWLDRIQDVIKDARRIQHLMNYVLYAGAAAMVAGLLEVIATLSWSFAPFPTTADLKVQLDLCKSISLPMVSVVPMPATSAGDVCAAIAGQLQAAITVDELRQFTRAVGIIFGAAFSALLAAMYLPVALAQQDLVDLVTRILPRKPESAEGAKPKAGDVEPELDRTAVQRVFNVLAALGPLAAAIVSATFGL